VTLGSGGIGSRPGGMFTSMMEYLILTAWLSKAATMV